MKRIFALAMILAAQNAGAAEPGDPAAGHHVAMSLCSVCHDTGPDQTQPPMRLTPSTPFAEIANRPGTTTDSLMRFLATTHWDMKSLPMAMPDFGLTDKQRADAAAYIISLRK